MDEQGTNPSDKQEQSTKLLPLDHDAFFTNTFQTKRLAKGFLRVVLSEDLCECLDLDGLTIEPRHVSDDLAKRDRIADVVYRVPITKTEHHIDFFVILEHKSFNDVWTIFQLWMYVYFICRREYDKAEDAGEGWVPANYRLPPVIAIIVHHGESRFTGKTELSDLFLQMPGIEKYLPKLQALLFDLNTIADEAIPEDPEVPEMKLALAALKMVFRKDVATKITEILEELKPITDDPVVKDFVRAVWCYLVCSAKYMERYEELQEVISRVMEVESMPTMFEKWTAERRVEWEAKAKAEGKAETVLAVLRTKFAKIPNEVENAISQMTDPIALDSWAVQAAICQSMDEFVEAFE